MKILVTDPISETTVKKLREKGIEVELKYDFPKERIGEILDNFDGIIVRSATKLGGEILENTKNLKLIVRGGVGLDNIDLKKAKEKGITVFNTPEASTIAVAELTIGFLFALSRFIPQATFSLKGGKWEKKKFEGTEIYGKTLGIIGMGRIGKEVAKRAKALGMRTLGFDPFVKEAEGAEMVDLNFLVQNSDYITLHTPLTEETKYLVNKELIDKMKPGVFIINCARGGLIEEEALYQALKSGKIRGAAFDVFEREPPQNNKLLELENF
ncbi:MAG: hydroxyacid dehydrogenase, partial [Patescibacteria group bacterium]|nr:hydroxyacid dehydrogenase [Patescibacteria group bacterium]